MGILSSLENLKAKYLTDLIKFKSILTKTVSKFVLRVFELNLVILLGFSEPGGKC